MLRVKINQQLRNDLYDRFLETTPNADWCEWGGVEESLWRQLADRLARLVMDQLKVEGGIWVGHRQ